MRNDPPFVPDRFQSTVPFYVEHRLRFPPELIVEVARRVGLTKQDRVLDLGCGPGTLTIELARCGAGEVVGMDPDSAMLAGAHEEAMKANVEPSFVQGSSYDLSPAMGPYTLVTMGRSFHWMDREATLKALDGIVEPQGAIAIFSETAERAVENRWKSVVVDVQQQYIGLLRDGGTRHHAAVLLDSVFSRLESYAVIRRLPVTLDGIIGRALSQLESSPAGLGDRRSDFEQTLRNRLLTLSPSGKFSEIIQFAALIACRQPSK